MGFTQSVKFQNVNFPDVDSMVDNLQTMLSRPPLSIFLGFPADPVAFPSPGGLKNVATPSVPASAL
jgi:hypothetical protein